MGGKIAPPPPQASGEQMAATTLPTMLADDRVLISAGVDDKAQGVATAEVYDPASGKFSPAGSMAPPCSRTGAS